MLKLRDTKLKICALLRPALPLEEAVREAFISHGYSNVLEVVRVPGSISVYTDMSECWAVGLLSLMRALHASDVMAIQDSEGLCFEFVYM